mmetsp:Transcript_2936/g.8758  ORF Transcript_2936/g.8758 Transcript_2936/m.8758 type:complete len:144 (+) Transcript_2936:63-494(+)
MGNGPSSGGGDLPDSFSECGCADDDAALGDAHAHSLRERDIVAQMIDALVDVATPPASWTPQAADERDLASAGLERARGSAAVAQRGIAATLGAPMDVAAQLQCLEAMTARALQGFDGARYANTDLISSLHLGSGMASHGFSL